MKSRSKKFSAPKAFQIVKNHIVYGFTKGMIAFARTIPLHWGLFLGTVMGRLAYWVVIAERKKAENHLKIVFPEKDGRWRRETVKQMYANFGKSFFE